MIAGVADGVGRDAARAPGANRPGRAPSTGPEPVKEREVKLGAPDASGVIRLMRHDPVVRLDTDPEGVHHARVATRRLRSDLRTFRTVLDQEWTAALREELGWLGGELGAARDAGVLLERLTAHVGELPEPSGEAPDAWSGLGRRGGVIGIRTRRCL